MKKVLATMALLLIGLAASAQGEMKNGVWENKRVVEVQGASTATLYTRALEALSDLAGSEGKSKIGIDMQDKEEGLVVYKGEYYLGRGKASLSPMQGWDTWANFTLKIRCKEGRAQVSVSVPSLTFRFTGVQTETVGNIGDMIPEFKYKSKYTNKKAAMEFAPKVPKEFENVITAMCKRLANGTSDDDF